LKSSQTHKIDRYLLKRQSAFLISLQMSDRVLVLANLQGRTDTQRLRDLREIKVIFIVCVLESA